MTGFNAHGTALRTFRDQSVAAVVIVKQAKVLAKIYGQNEVQEDIAHELIVDALLVYGAGRTIQECSSVLYHLIKMV